MILIKQSKNQYLTHYIPAAIIALVAPMGYLAPLGEWLLIAFLSLTLLLNFMINPYKLNSYGLILFCAACGLIFFSYFWSISPARTAEVMLPKTGILFAILVVITTSSNIKIKNIHITLGISLMFTAVIIFLDLIFNAEIRSNLAQIAGDESTSSSGNYSRGLLIMTTLLPIVLSALLNKKFFIFATVLFLLASFSILLGPNSTAKITLLLSIVAAFLTIVGYSLNDTIVVFDRIRENIPKYLKKTLNDVVNLSLNETLNRTVITSLTTMMVVVILFVWGGKVINLFAFALIVGIFIGTYSSLFVASPVMVYFEKRSAGPYRK